MSARRVATAVAAVLLLSACGGSSSPAEEVPELAEALEQVDESLAAEDYKAAEEALTGLVDAAEQAEAEGTLSNAQSDDVVGAAEALLAQLPQETTPSPPEPEPTVAPEPEPEKKGAKPPKPPKEPKGAEEREEDDDKDKEDREEKEDKEGKGGDD